MAWVRAFDVTGDRRYLDAAKFVFQDMTTAWTTTPCGGGVWWNRNRDYKNAININSKNKATARAWIDWFADESNYAVDQGGIAPLRTAPAPSTLADFTAANVEYLELTPAPKGQEGLVQRIDGAAEIGLWEPKYRQRLVDAARGARKESKDDIFADLNRKWSAAKAKTK